MSRAVDSAWRRPRIRAFGAYLDIRRLASGATVILAKGGGQFALEDANSDGIRYFGGGVHCLLRGGRGGSIFETGAGFHGTVDENPTCSQ